jgi:hypothetical protein
MNFRKLLLIVLCLALLGTVSFAGERDMNASDLKGIPSHHKYIFSVLGGAALGAGLGIILPGGAKSAAKGALIGGSATSAFYLITHRGTMNGWNRWAYIGTNTALGTGLGWTVCNCGGGAAAGALIGGGGTAVLQSMGGRHNTTLGKITGTDTSH